MAGALPTHALLQACANDSPLAGRVTSGNVSPSGVLRLPVANSCCRRAMSRDAGVKSPLPHGQRHRHACLRRLRRQFQNASWSVPPGGHRRVKRLVSGLFLIFYNFYWPFGKRTSVCLPNGWCDTIVGTDALSTRRAKEGKTIRRPSATVGPAMRQSGRQQNRPRIAMPVPTSGSSAFILPTLRGFS